MKKPSYFVYGDYSNDNYGVHTLCFTDTNGNDFYYSYQTLVAFRCREGLFVRQNVWGSTTGKHLNWIDGGEKKERLTEEAFNEAFKKYIEREGV